MVSAAWELLSLRHDTPGSRPGGVRAILELCKLSDRLVLDFLALANRIQWTLDHLVQSAIAVQFKHVIDVLCFAPGNQIFPSEARVAANDNARGRPARANVLDDPADFFQRSISPISVGSSKTGAE
jgi:hypothetical protein